MKKQTETPTALPPQSLVHWCPRLLVFLVAVMLAGCAAGPPMPQAQEDPAKARAEAKAREEFASSLPKPPEN